MDEALKDDSSSTSAKVGRSVPKLLRYPLRSASKPREEKSPLTDASNSSVPRSRSTILPNVSKSVSILDLSGNDKSAKPPRRMSIPSKSSASRSLKLAGNITPISEAIQKKASRNQAKGDTPVSDIKNTRKFSVLLSASYWLSQIKVSEAAAKHLISLGFFRLALEAGCEPLQLVRDELKGYVRRHNLAQFEEPVKDVLERYNILEQLQFSESCLNVPEEETRSSDDDVRSSSSQSDIQKLKSKPSNSGAIKPYRVKDKSKEAPHKEESVNRPSRSGKISAANSKPGLKSGGSSNRQNSQPKQGKPESRKGCDRVTKQGQKSDDDQGLIKSSAEHELQENKENLDGSLSQDISA